MTVYRAQLEFSHLTDTGQVFKLNYGDYYTEGKAPASDMCRYLCTLPDYTSPSKLEVYKKDELCYIIPDIDFYAQIQLAEWDRSGIIQLDNKAAQRKKDRLNEISS